MSFHTILDQPDNQTKPMISNEFTTKSSVAEWSARRDRNPAVRGSSPDLGPVSRKPGLNSFASNMIKLSVSETKWSSLLARTGAFILYISI